MNQNLAFLETLATTGNAASATERVGFDIGWDHAHHGLVPPAELLHPGTPITQGWTAGKAVYGRRTLSVGRSTRQWLALRLVAWRNGWAFDTAQVTPNHLAQIHTGRCPVRRTPLGGAAGTADAPCIERLNPLAGYAAGNLALTSCAAAQARAGLNVAGLVRQARAAQSGTTQAVGMAADAWWRLAVLQSFATPLPFAEAAALPLAVMPPNRVRLLNAVQGLQALVTSMFMAPGWAGRCRALGASLPTVAARLDFNLFVGAMAPRVIEAAVEGVYLRPALEDAWLNERVLRRWQHFALALGEAPVEALLQLADHQRLGGVRTQWHAPEQAIEGWALADGGRQRSRSAPMPARAAARLSAPGRVHRAALAPPAAC